MVETFCTSEPDVSADRRSSQRGDPGWVVPSGSISQQREAMHTGHSLRPRPIDITQQTWSPRLDTGTIFDKPTHC